MRELPSSRWRSAPGAGARGAADRVRVSHAQARVTLRLALLFVGAAAVAAAVGAERWLALHLFLAGGVLLAISGVSVMLTVTWSAAPAPGGGWVAAQRALVASGAAGLAFGRTADLREVVAIAAAAYLAGIVLLAILLVVTVRRGPERRFDPAVIAYVVALSAGTVGAALGAWMALGSSSASLRSAHVTVNVLGLVGLVVGGTMPYFVATVGRTRMAPHASARRLTLSICWLGTSVLVAAVGLSSSAPVVAGAALGAYAAGVLAVLESLPRPTRRSLQWAGPRLVAVWAGGLWWSAAVAASAIDATAERIVLGDRWLLVVVVAGYGQILWGSLAYLLPMLRGGGHERLAAGFAATRSWIGLAAANAAGVCAATGLPAAVTAVPIAVLVLDGAWRVTRVAVSADT